MSPDFPGLYWQRWESFGSGVEESEVRKAWGANENKTKNFALTSDVERERMQEKQSQFDAHK